MIDSPRGTPRALHSRTEAVGKQQAAVPLLPLCVQDLQDLQRVYNISRNSSCLDLSKEHCGPLRAQSLNFSICSILSHCIHFPFPPRFTTVSPWDKTSYNVQIWTSLWFSQLRKIRGQRLLQCFLAQAGPLGTNTCRELFYIYLLQ